MCLLRLLRMDTVIPYLDLKRLHQDTTQWLPAATAALQSGWFLRGEQTRLFEQEYAAYIGTEHCVGCGNGLDALTLILRAYKELGHLHDGDEVIVPANTYIASILSITENGLAPILVEPDWNTLQIDDSLIEQHITPRTKAIMLVHLYGICAYTSKIAKICKTHNLLLIEDNAQAHGCTYTDENGTVKRTGSLGDVAAHSFYPTKNLGAMGDAGAVTTNDQELANLIRSIANYGSGRKYVFDHIGRNSRMDEVQAAILRSLLPMLDKRNARRKGIATQYYNNISNKGITMPRNNRDSVFHIFPIFTSHRGELQQHLKECGIGTEIHYPIPPHKQKCYSEWNSLSLPITEKIHSEELSLPCNPYMTDEEVNRVIECLK